MPRRPMLLEYGPHILFDSFVKIWATCEMFLGKCFPPPPPPPGKKFPVRLWKFQTGIFVEWKAPNNFFYTRNQHFDACYVHLYCM